MALGAITATVFSLFLFSQFPGPITPRIAPFHLHTFSIQTSSSPEVEPRLTSDYDPVLVVTMPGGQAIRIALMLTSSPAGQTSHHLANSPSLAHSQDRELIAR